MPTTQGLPATPLPRTPQRLAENVMHFGRVLRSAGLAVGTDRIQAALGALQVAGLDSRRDFHAVLQACLLDRIEHQELFDQAFVLFWRDPDLAGRIRAMMLPKVRTAVAPVPRESRRLADALFPKPPQAPEPPPGEDELELDAAMSASERELLRKTDFDSMSPDEWRHARRLLASVPLAIEPLPTRRSVRAVRGAQADWRATLRDMARHGGELWELRRRQRRTRPAPLLVLADISGSMSRYSRMLLHFAHLLALAHQQVECFVFGTRLTRITRQLRSRDPDVALAQVVQAVQDWSGGTRITLSLREFNRRWSRRVLDSRATVLLISDGLEHDSPVELGFEMERLRKSCRRLVWLNPLLRFAGFEPRAGGIRAMLPHVDHFAPAHNLQSLEALLDLLRAPAQRRRPPTI